MKSIPRNGAARLRCAVRGLAAVTIERRRQMSQMPYAQRVARLLVVGSVVFLFRDRYGYRNRTTPCQTTKIRSNATHHSFRMRPKVVLLRSCLGISMLAAKRRKIHKNQTGCWQYFVFLVPLCGYSSAVAPTNVGVYFIAISQILSSHSLQSDP